MRFLLDTNVLSELRRRHNAHPAVVAWARDKRPSNMFTSVLVMGEIRRGIESRRRRDPKQAADLGGWFHDLKARLAGRILPVDDAIADAWALMNVPDMLPTIDGLLAATAKVHDLTLVTRNVRDVARTGVRLVDPFVPDPTVS